MIMIMTVMISMLVMINTDPGGPGVTAGRQVHLGATIIRGGGGGGFGSCNAFSSLDAVHCFIKCDQTFPKIPIGPTRKKLAQQ